MTDISDPERVREAVARIRAAVADREAAFLKGVDRLRWSGIGNDRSTATVRDLRLDDLQLVLTLVAQYRSAGADLADAVRTAIAAKQYPSIIEALAEWDYVALSGPVSDSKS